MSARDALIEINTGDFLESIALHKSVLARRVLGPLIRPAASYFADQVLDYDADVGRNGLQQASKAFGARVTGGIRCDGVAGIPAEGPLLFTSNHPGMADTISLFACIPRTDLSIIANDRQFLRYLQNIHGRHLIDVPSDPGQRMQAMRSMMRALRQGRAALTFPAGRIEPDPAVWPGARESLNSWAESIGLLVKLVPGLTVIPVIVSGVLHPAAQFHPLTKLRRGWDNRQRLGATLQLMFKRYQTNRVHVSFGAPLSAPHLLAQSQDAGEITRLIAEAAGRLLGRPSWPP